MTRLGPTLRHRLAMADAAGADGRRSLIGICGPPGAGKTTLATLIAAEYADHGIQVGMDGFHLARRELERLGREGRKGAIDTFDAQGFVALIRRIREDDGSTVYAPEFRREIEEPIAGAVAIREDVRLVIVEGNYLLVDAEPWDQLRDLFDEVWYCDRDDDERVRDLVARHEAFGKSPADALRWATGSDADNAALIAATRDRATHIVNVADGRFELV